MTSSSTVVIQNLAYLVGAIVLAIVIGLAVWLRHRPPRSVDANVESFHRGLRALAPDSGGPVARPAGLRIQPPATAAPAQEEPEGAGPPPGDENDDEARDDGEEVVTVRDDADEPAPEATEVVDLSQPEGHHTGAGEAAGDRAGAETG